MIRENDVVYNMLAYTVFTANREKQDIMLMAFFSAQQARAKKSSIIQNKNVCLIAHDNSHTRLTHSNDKIKLIYVLI